jgi:hypothetical protein
MLELHNNRVKELQDVPMLESSVNSHFFVDGFALFFRGTRRQSNDFTCSNPVFWDIYSAKYAGTKMSFTTYSKIVCIISSPRKSAATYLFDKFIA